MHSAISPACAYYMVKKRYPAVYQKVIISFRCSIEAVNCEHKAQVVILNRGFKKKRKKICLAGISLFLKVAKSFLFSF